VSPRALFYGVLFSLLFWVVLILAWSVLT